MTEHRWPVVLFDLDGTLANTIPLIIASYRYAWRTVLHTEADWQRARGWIGVPLRQAFEREAPEHAEALYDEYARFQNQNRALTRPYEGITQAIYALADAGLTMGVVTSKSRASAAATMEVVGLGGSMPILVAMEDTTERKPSPAPILRALEKLQVDPSEVVYVGDTANDAEAAQTAGVAMIAVTWGAGLRSDLLCSGSQFVLDTPAALVDALTA